MGPDLVVEGLLNALESERHLRRPLVVELIESIPSLDDSHTRAAAQASARRLLARLDSCDAPLSERDWKSAVAELREDITAPRQHLVAGPRSAVMMVRPSTAIAKKVA